MERSLVNRILLISGYIGAAVAANLVVTNFGPWALVFTAFILIPFDLVARDVLHEAWDGKYLLIKMGLLISIGSTVSYLINSDSGPIATASFVAFFAAGATNFLFYSLCKSLKTIYRMNVSNFFASIVDSLLFPLIAFGMFDWALFGSQASAKFVGGILWSLLFYSFIKRFRR